jgi:hypothetical protein
MSTVEKLLTLSTFDIGDWLEPCAKAHFSLLSSVLPLARRLPVPETGCFEDVRRSREDQRLAAWLDAAPLDEAVRKEKRRLVSGVGKLNAASEALGAIGAFLHERLGGVR